MRKLLNLYIYVLCVMLLLARGLSAEECSTKSYCHECIQSFEGCGWCPETGSCVKLGNNSCSSVHSPSGYDVVVGNSDVNLTPTTFAVHLRPGISHTVSFQVTNAILPLEIALIMDSTGSINSERASIVDAVQDTFTYIQSSIHAQSKMAYTAARDHSHFPWGWSSSCVYDSDTYTEILDDWFYCRYFPFMIRLPFTTNRVTFETELAISIRHSAGGRLWPGGSLGAIVNSVTCVDELGWGDHTRKMAMVTTDATVHAGGDGFAGNIWRPHGMTCLPAGSMKGIATNNLPPRGMEDWATVGQIRQVMQDYNVYPVLVTTPATSSWAYATPDSFADYVSIFGSGSVGDLSISSGSSNLDQVVQLAYQDMSSKVQVLVGESDIIVNVDPEIVTGASLSTTYDFDLTFEWVAGTFTPGIVWTTNVTLTAVSLGKAVAMIYPVDQCNCTLMNESCPGDCSTHGICNCGLCECETGYTGVDCNCSTTACPIGLDGSQCGQYGECVCGECVCDPGFQAHSKVGFTCDCSNNCENQAVGITSLDLSRGSCYVNGTEGTIDEELKPCCNHGECVCGECECVTDYDGDFCECHNVSCSSCVFGTCTCGECICDDEHSGPTCECLVGQCPDNCFESEGKGFCDCLSCNCTYPYILGPDLNCDCLDLPCQNNCSRNITSDPENLSECECGVCACDTTHGWPNGLVDSLGNVISLSYEDIVAAHPFLTTIYGFNATRPAVEDCSCYNAEIDTTCSPRGGAELCHKCYCDVGFYGEGTCACHNETDTCEAKFGGCVHGTCVIKQIGDCEVTCECDDGWKGDTCEEDINVEESDICLNYKSCESCYRKSSCGWCAYNSTAGNTTIDANGTVIPLPGVGWAPADQWNSTCYNQTGSWNLCPWAFQACPTDPPRQVSDDTQDIIAMAAILSFLFAMLAFLLLFSLVATFLFCLAAIMSTAVRPESIIVTEDVVDSINPIYEEMFETNFNPLFEGADEDGGGMEDLGDIDVDDTPDNDDMDYADDGDE